MMNLQKIHDGMFKNAIVTPEDVQKVLSLLPAQDTKDFDIENITIESDTYVDDRLREHFSDLVVSCKWIEQEEDIAKVNEKKQAAEKVPARREKPKDAKVSFIFEHKSQNEVLLRLQLTRYVTNAYELQYKQKKSTPLDLVVTVLLKHGDSDWQVPEFSHYVHTPSDKYNDFVPRFKILLLNLSKVTDEELRTLGYCYLFSTLFLLKHKGNKVFIKQHYKEIFTFVNVENNVEILVKQVELLTFYIFRAFKLEEEEVQEMFEQVPPIIKNPMQNTYDRIREEVSLDVILKAKEEGHEKGHKEGHEKGHKEGHEKGHKEGHEKGHKEGHEKGHKEGHEIGYTKSVIEIAVSMFSNMPFLKNEEMAKVTQMKVEIINQLRNTFHQKKEEEVKKLVKVLFKDVPNLTKEKTAELEKWLLELWNNFRKLFSKPQN